MMHSSSTQINMLHLSLLLLDPLGVLHGIIEPLRANKKARNPYNAIKDRISVIVKVLMTLPHHHVSKHVRRLSVDIVVLHGEKKWPVPSLSMW